MYVKANAVVDLMGFFVSNRVGKSGLPAKVDVIEWRSSGPETVVSNANAVDLGGGLYGYRHTVGSDSTVLGIFKTTDATVDMQNIPSMALNPAKEDTVEVISERLSEERAEKIDTLHATVETNLDLKVSTLPGLVSADVSGVNGAEIAEAVVTELYATLASADAIVMGQGLGSVVINTKLDPYTDLRVTSNGTKGVRDAVVRAFLKTGDNVDWQNIQARTETDHLGDFILYLNPGDYIFSFEKGGVQMATSPVTIVE